MSPRRDDSKPETRNPKLKTPNPKPGRLVPLLLGWFERQARDLPWRRTRDPYAIWVSEIMLQQTQVSTVLPYWKRWMRGLPTIASLARASSERIHQLWEGLGYYTRVRNMQKAARQIVQLHAGKFPETFKDVLALPGIGRYTAGAICSIAFNQPTPVLDGNVIRVLTRLFGIAQNPRERKTNDRLWKLAENLVAHASRFTPRASHLNQSLMELGALICTPRRPQCRRCPVARHCVARRRNRIGDLPNLGPRASTMRKRVAAFVVRSEGRFLVRQRPAGVVNAYLWEFPNAELNGPETDPRRTARRVLGFSPRDLKPLCCVKHSITRYRITMTAFAVDANGAMDTTRTRGEWVAASKLKQLPLPGAHRKIVAALRSRLRRPPGHPPSQCCFGGRVRG